MKVLSVASEAVPLVKTGGLADVAGALPRPLAHHGISMRLFLPGYSGVLAHAELAPPVHAYADLHGGAAAIREGRVDDFAFFCLDAPHLFRREGGPYASSYGGDWPDNWRRFAAFSRAAADLAEGVGSWVPDIVHAHDWQAALTLAYLRYGPRGAMPSVMTVHNLAFQGQFSAGIFPSLGLPDRAMALDGVEYYGGVGYLKAGLQAATEITTVSPTYAREIMTPAFGMGLDGLLAGRAANVHGILNGIDTDGWNPAEDPHLAAGFDQRNMKARAQNRAAVEAHFGLDPGEGPIVAIISRLTWQKGTDLIAARIDRIADMGIRLAILGSGDSGLEGAMLAAAARHRGRIGAVIGYDEGLSHLMQGGCDAILVPSRFEPCGLTQLYALRYGCVPVVSRTGGLADTVIEANEAAISAGAATGFLFRPDHADAMVEALERMMLVHARPGDWRGLQKAGMRTDVSWQHSAARYAELYRDVIKQKDQAR